MRKKRRAGASRGRPHRRWLRRILAVLLVIAVIPLLLTPIYRLPFVHPLSTLMLADLVTLNGYERQWTPLEEIGPAVVHSVMMSEDGQFCFHYGLDLGELRAVMDDFFSGGKPRGASTIPMQTVKNLFLWPGRSFLRKALEAPLAVYFDAIVPKQRIMEIYLNIAEWGPGIYGVEAASQHYFGKPTKSLSARQAALLAVTLPNPHARNPARPSQGLNRLASVIEGRARRSGAYIQCLQ
ncbi:transglycosylase domain-containing protein [Chelativorans sp. Marseille-P2723]|uniref:biosynthetic peptidoglycan transglycosylase n=1 Tax=Chelativorans sp. Marseille-P2723 TaxID=2709133 RepID=UPI001FEEF624|nr:transglycosylase domain-containing protein [Chelativorans sp. Marseille-P2723]